MRSPVLLAAAIIGAITLVGCNTGAVTEADQQAVNEAFSREAYEDAMIRAGREEELRAEQARDAERMRQDGQVEGQE